MLTSVALRIVRNKHDAEDVVQQSFERVMALRLKGNGPQDDIVAYLVTTVRNQALNLVTRRRETPAERDTLDAVSEVQSPEAVLVNHEEVATAAAAFHELPLAERQVLGLIHLEGLSRAEAAQLAGLSLSGLDARLARAREALRVGYIARVIGRDPQQASDDHPGAHAIVRYARGTSRVRESRRISHHITKCQLCASSVVEVDAVSVRLSDVTLLALIAALPATGWAQVGRTGLLATALARGGVGLAASVVLGAAAFLLLGSDAPSGDVPTAERVEIPATQTGPTIGHSGAHTDGLPASPTDAVADPNAPSSAATLDGTTSLSTGVSGTVVAPLIPGATDVPTCSGGACPDPAPSPTPNRVQAQVQWDTSSIDGVFDGADPQVAAGTSHSIDFVVSADGQGASVVVDVLFELPAWLELDPLTSPQCVAVEGATYRCGRIVVASGATTRGSLRVVVVGSPRSFEVPIRIEYVTAG